MQVHFATARLKKQLEEDSSRIKHFGVDMAQKIRLRLAALDGAENLSDFWPANSKPERCHELKGARAGVFSMDLVQPYRLLFRRGLSNEEKLDVAPGIGEWRHIEAVVIVGIENTHD